MRGGIRGNCNKCGSITEIASLDLEILCPMCQLKTLDEKILLSDAYGIVDKAKVCGLSTLTIFQGVNEFLSSPPLLHLSSKQFAIRSNNAVFPLPFPPVTAIKFLFNGISCSSIDSSLLIQEFLIFK